MKNSTKNVSIFNHLWDAFCVASIIGIWPRFIEPQWLVTKKLTLPISNLPKGLHGLKILQFSDLHLNESFKDSFLKKIVHSINILKPDLIVFTGDFLCYSALENSRKLQEFLCQLTAPYGCYAILGNHDYQKYVSINQEGVYDVLKTQTTLVDAFKRLFTRTTLTKTVSLEAQNVPPHPELIDMLSKTPFKLLHNETAVIEIDKTGLNICGCGEHILGRLQPAKAFANYNSNYPGIILAHNPDAIPHLKNYPGNLILCGHTHGGQVNLPWMWKKFTLLENMDLKKGLKHLDNRWVYINRGISSVIPFRWFSPPELLLITLEQKHA